MAGNNGNNDIQLDLNQDQAGQVVQQNVPAGGQTTLPFRVEHLKVPDFWGQKAKDNEGPEAKISEAVCDSNRR